MSEPVVTTEALRDPIQPDPAIERDRRIIEAMDRIAELNVKVMNCRLTRIKAEQKMHQYGAELTKDRQELARLVNRE